MAQRNPSPASTSNSNPTSPPTSTPPSTPNPPPSTPDYTYLYRWAPDALLKETSNFTSLASITAYRKKQTCHKSRVFGKDHDKYVRMVPCRVGEPVCSDESSDPEGPFCFIYSTVFRRLGLRLPFTPFERALLTEVNVALPNYTLTIGRSWGSSISCATTLAIRHQWTCSSTSSRWRAQARSCGSASLGGCCWRSSSSPIRVLRSTFSKCGAIGGTPLS